MVEQGERRSAGLRQGGEVGPRVELRYDGHEKRLEFLEFSYTRARHGEYFKDFMVDMQTSTQPLVMSRKKVLERITENSTPAKVHLEAARRKQGTICRSYQEGT